ncbi:hypothetical protein H1Q59_02440 [Holosporaceae bacterium 'Namur']|nr:hypothetical protein [Holosporaceae bacterium 'Namur']
MNNFISWGAGVFRDAVNKVTDTVSSIFKSMFGEYEVKDPLSEAMTFLERAKSLDDVYSWTIHNALSYFYLLKESKGIVDIAQAEDAGRIKQTFYEHSVNAYKAINDTVIPQLESQLAYLMMQNVINSTDDLTLQLAGSIELYKKIIELIAGNINVISESGGDQGIRVKRGVGLSKVINKINMTEAIMQFANNSIETKANSRTLLTGLADPVIFKGSQITAAEIEDLGGRLFEIEAYDLDNDNDWFGTIFSALIGIAQIVIGATLLMTPGLSAFAAVFAKGMIISGISDIVSSAISIINGTPIDPIEFFKSKGITYAINLITAGLGQLGTNLNLFEGLAQGFKKVGQVTTFIKEGAAIAVGIQAVGAVLYNVGKHAVLDKDELEAKVRNEIETLVAQYMAQLKQIFAADTWNKNNQAIENMLMKQAEEIIKGYSKKFTDTGTQSILGGLSSLIGLVASGYGIWEYRRRV